MSKPAERTFRSDFRRFFLRGLVVLLPSVLTLWIAVKAYQFVYFNIAEPINRGVRLVIVNTGPYWSALDPLFLPTEAEVDAELARRIAKGETVAESQVRAELERAAVTNASVRGQRLAVWWTDRWYLDLIGLIVAILAVYFAGRLLGGFLGRRVYRKLEQLLTTVPVFKQIYPYVKQIVDFLFSDEQPIKFNRVVVVEYPRKGIWSLGFMTGSALRIVSEHAGDAVTIFIPSSPTPFTGYTITVPRNEVIELPLTVEEAIRFVVSGGVLAPDHQRVALEAPTGAILTTVDRQPAQGRAGTKESEAVLAKGPPPARRGRDAR